VKGGDEGLALPCEYELGTGPWAQTWFRQLFEFKPREEKKRIELGCELVVKTAQGLIDLSVFRLRLWLHPQAQAPSVDGTTLIKSAPNRNLNIQGLRGTSYPGFAAKSRINPERVAAI
jgi:hypothetical protein